MHDDFMILCMWSDLFLMQDGWVCVYVWLYDVYMMFVDAWWMCAIWYVCVCHDCSYCVMNARCIWLMYAYMICYFYLSCCDCIYPMIYAIMIMLYGCDAHGCLIWLPFISTYDLCIISWLYSCGSGTNDMLMNWWIICVLNTKKKE